MRKGHSARDMPARCNRSPLHTHSDQAWDLEALKLGKYKGLLLNEGLNFRKVWFITSEDPSPENHTREIGEEKRRPRFVRDLK